MHTMRTGQNLGEIKRSECTSTASQWERDDIPNGYSKATKKPVSTNGHVSQTARHLKTSECLLLAKDIKAQLGLDNVSKPKVTGIVEKQWERKESSIVNLKANEKPVSTNGRVNQTVKHLTMNECLLLAKEIKSKLGLDKKSRYKASGIVEKQSVKFWKEVVFKCGYNQSSWKSVKKLFIQWMLKSSAKPRNSKISKPDETTYTGKLSSTSQRNALARTKDDKSFTGKRKIRTLGKRLPKASKAKVATHHGRMKRLRKDGPATSISSTNKTATKGKGSLQGVLTVNDNVESGTVEAPINDGCFISALLKYRTYKGVVFDMSSRTASLAGYSLKEMLRRHRIAEKQLNQSAWEIVPEKVRCISWTKTIDVTDK